MKKSQRHERLKKQERGRKERPVKKGRLDVSTRIKDVEIQRDASPQNLRHAIGKLKDSTKPQRVLRVPQKDIKKAADLAKQMRANITITNIGKTKSNKIK